MAHDSLDVETLRGPHGFAYCKDCGLEMAIGAGCTAKPGGRIPYGERREAAIADKQPCHDCNVTKGQLHHIGCDMERCPACFNQAISCTCSDRVITKAKSKRINAAV